MAERTTDEVAKIFTNAGDSVTIINGNKGSDDTDAEWKDRLQRNQLAEQKNAAAQHFTELSGALKTLQELEEANG